MNEITGFAANLVSQLLKTEGTPAEKPVEAAVIAAVDAGFKVFAAVQAVAAQRKAAGTK